MDEAVRSCPHTCCQVLMLFLQSLSACQIFFSFPSPLSLHSPDLPFERAVSWPMKFFSQLATKKLSRFASLDYESSA